jgi:hypothetical protein
LLEILTFWYQKFKKKYFLTVIYYDMVVSEYFTNIFSVLL